MALLNWWSQELTTTNTLLRTSRYWNNPWWNRIGMVVGTSSIIDCYVSKGCDSDNIASRSSVSVNKTPAPFPFAQFPFTSVTITDRRLESEALKLAVRIHPPPPSLPPRCSQTTSQRLTTGRIFVAQGRSIGGYVEIRYMFVYSLQTYISSWKRASRNYEMYVENWLNGGNRECTQPRCKAWTDTMSWKTHCRLVLIKQLLCTMYGQRSTCLYHVQLCIL